MYDVAIVGSGPAGASCAIACARAGLRTLVLEREKFPREKVCGDCLNPACWPALERLGVAPEVRAAPHGKLEQVEFIGIGGRVVRLNLPAGETAEIALKRSALDAILQARARQLGAEVVESAAVTALSESDPGWSIITAGRQFAARVLMAADGRNSTVARLCQLLPPVSRERIALQTHLALPAGFGNRVVLQFRPEGYSGQAPVGPNELNLCLVSRASGMQSLRRWAELTFSLAPDQVWRTITPLARAAVAPARRRLFLVGDAARVVEPFTGEGIYYALRSGELAAAAATQLLAHGADDRLIAGQYAAEHAAMYRGRLWINRLARAAVLSPRIASRVLSVARHRPEILRWLTGKIVT